MLGRATASDLVGFDAIRFGEDFGRTVSDMDRVILPKVATVSLPREA